jgi:hypothetical protein
VRTPGELCYYHDAAAAWLVAVAEQERFQQSRTTTASQRMGLHGGQLWAYNRVLGKPRAFAMQHAPNVEHSTRCF